MLGWSNHPIGGLADHPVKTKTKNQKKKRKKKYVGVVEPP
jgi:hypothetical protein